MVQELAYQSSMWVRAKEKSLVLEKATKREEVLFVQNDMKAQV